MSQGPRFPAPNCSQQDFNNSVLNTLNELSSSLRELRDQTQTRHDQPSSQTSCSSIHQNISGQDCSNDQVDNNASAYGEKDQYSDISPYSPNSNLEQGNRTKGRRFKL